MVFIKLEQSIANQLHIKTKKENFFLAELEELQQKVKTFNQNNPNQHIYLHKLIKPEHIYLQQDKIILEQESYEDPPEIKKEKLERERRVKEQQYQQMIKGIPGPAQLTGKKNEDNVKSYEKSISFGTSFIFSFFLSGLAGYYLGKYIFEWPHYHCMILGVTLLIGSLILETTLFMVKIIKEDKIKRINDKKNAREQKDLYSSESKQQSLESLLKDKDQANNLLEKSEQKVNFLEMARLNKQQKKQNESEDIKQRNQEEQSSVQNKQVEEEEQGDEDKTLKKKNNKKKKNKQKNE